MITRTNNYLILRASLSISRRIIISFIRTGPLTFRVRIRPLSFPSKISLSTLRKKFKLLMLLIDFASNNLLKGSPSSIKSWFLITCSEVTLFPNIFILSINTFSSSKILNVKFNLFSIKFLATFALIDLNCSLSTTLSIFSKIFSILLTE